ncbi:MAG: chloride channel protein [Acidobacteriaceae bacterium]
MSESDAVRIPRSLAQNVLTQPDAPAIAAPAHGAPTLSDADINRIAPTRGDRLFLILSIFIGVLSGLLVVCFRISIAWLQVLLLGSVPHPGQYRLLLAPMGVGLIVGLLVKYFFPQAKGSGINQTKAALYVYNGYISARTMIGKFITAALAIGSGHSLGPEDPSLQIGAGVASLIGRRLHLSRERLRLFAPVGAAAGLAAAFNAPISAILFVIEEVIGTWSAAVLGSIVLAALSSVVVAQHFWGREPMFHVPAVTFRDSSELLAYAVLGVVGGFAAVLFSRLLGTLRPWLRSLPGWSQPMLPAAAGLLVGCIGFFGFPQVMGAGYEVIDHAMHGEYLWHVLLALAILKIVATTISFSSGTPGGMFAPTLFIGAMLGASVGSVEKIFFPHLTGSVGAYALVGMGVLFAGFLRVPLTSVFMVFELSGNYSVVLPVILANTLAYLIARSLQPVPIFEQLTLQDGLVLPSVEEAREETSLRVEDALHAWEGQIFAGSDTPATIAAKLEQEKEDVALIRCSGSRWYVLPAADLAKIMGAVTSANQPIEQLLPEDRVPLLYPDLPLNETLAYFPRWPLLPIVNRAVSGLLEGVVSQVDVLQCYQQHSHSYK